MRDDILIRHATLADVETVARHRAAMFLDMGAATPEVVERLTSDSQVRLREAISRGEYVGWLASLSDEPERIVAGAGVQVRRVLPFPRLWPDRPADVAEGHQAIVLNVYTEPAFRRQGLARRLMREILEWARGVRLDSLVLHAAPAGRPLYEELGFAATNEMRYVGDLTGAGGHSAETPPDSG